jgi:uncharacterized repeat protein (TIGR01451 family)
VLVVAFLAPTPTQAQLSGLGISNVVVFPSTTTVGDQNTPAALVLTNNSFGAPLNNQNVTVSNIRINPSCDDVSVPAAVCGAPEPRPIPTLPVFDIEPPGVVTTDPIGPVATGRAGTACAGTVFTVSPPDASGTVTLTPSTPVVLGPSNVGGAGAQCIIDFTFDTLQRPLDGDTIATSQVDLSTAPNPGQPGTTLSAPNAARGFSPVIVINEAPTTIVTAASPAGGVPGPAPQVIPLGANFMDTATVTGAPFGPPLSGSVIFRLYRVPPGAAFPTCAAGELVATSPPVPLIGQTAPFTATPPSATATFTPPSQPAGNYVFVATYDEANTDVNYTGSATGCGDVAERVVVQPPLPSIRVDKTVNPTTLPEPGGTATFTVTVINTGPTDVTLTSLNDNVYGNLAARPGSTCTVAPPGSLPPTPPLLTANGGTYTCTFTGPVTGAPGSTHTDVVTANAIDVNGNTATDDDDAVVTIVGVPPVITVFKDATPLTRPQPGGTFTYTVRVRNDSPNETVTITSLNDDVYGNLATRPGSTCGTLIGTTLAPGATSAPCTFTGDFFAAPGQTLTDVVTAVATDDDGQTATDTDDAVVGITDVAPTVRVVKTASPTSMAAPGGTFTFTAVVTNTSAEPVTITSLNDNIYGNLATIPGSTCGALIGTTLAPGASSAPCTFPGAFSGAAGATQTDVVTAVVTDSTGNTATDDDDATVTITGAPVIRVDKTADPASLPEPGGTFTFNVVVTNVGPEPLTITSLTDNIYGNIATQGTCTTAIGTVLPANGGTYTCSFPGTFTGPAGATQTDIVTVVGQSPTGTQVTDTDDATVTITNVVPVVEVIKTAAPLTRPAPGGTFTFTVVVRNPSAEPITIQSLNDAPYGNLATRPGSTCGALIGTTLAPGASSAPCTFTGDFTGAAGANQTDVVTVTATDATGTVVTDTDDATVSIIGITPAISVDKSATPPSLPAPGGTFTFNVVVTNTGPNSLTITSLTDDIYGNLATRGTCTTAIGTVLPSGGSYSCSFQGPFNGVGGASQTDVVTVTGQDVNGTVVTDNDDATVTLTSVTPTVRVNKAATPASLPEPGGAFTFTASVTNTGPNPVTITSLNDNVFGDLATRPGSTCGALIGTTLAPGATSPTCTFQGNFFGNAGASETDVVTVVVTDNQGQTATDNDEATVTITNVPPTIDVVKTANPLTRPAPGGTFTFDVVVTNNSFEPVTITSLQDSVYGSLDGRGTCAIGASLPANGGTYTCSFTGDFNGAPNASQTDIVTVIAIDDDGTTVTDFDDATVTLTGVPATLTTVASAGSVGSEVFDTATLAGGFNPTGTITFRLYGPFAAGVTPACTGTPIFTSVKPVAGATDPRIIESARFVLPSTGVYVFTATYSGDVNNPAITTACDDPAETIGVGRMPTSLTTDASSNVLVGGQIFDVATVSGGVAPTGNVRFDLFGPGNTACSGTPIFTSTVAVNGNGDYESARFTPSQPGVYRWVATYSGDTNNASVTTSCADPLEQVEVSTVPIIRVEKTATPTTLVAPGGNVVFDVVVTNTTNVPLTIRSLVDNVYGDLTKIAGSTCASAIGTVLQPSPGPGNTYSCRFTGPVQGAAGSTHTDIVTVTATDSTGRTVTDDDDATVTITAVLPTITSTKTASPTSLPEPGGTFGFTFSVTNTGPNPVTITSLVDSIYGDLNGRGTCAVGAVLATGATYTCTFSGNFNGNAGAAQTDVITVTARDNQGQTVTSQSQATVTITDVRPTIVVTKTPDPISRPAPGGSFRFTVTVTNTSFEPVTVTSLFDDIYGNLNGRGSCAIGVVLAANGGSYSCAFDGEFRGQAGASQTDTVTAIVVDNDNTSVTETAKATVTLTPTGTPIVVPPPAPPVVQPPVVIQTPPQVLVRTGSDLSGPARLAGLLLIVGMTLIAATRRFGDGPGLAMVPVGPGGGPRGPWSGGGGPRGGGSHWFDGGARLRPPRGPSGGSSGGAARPLPAPPAPLPEPASVFDWDGWVGGRRAVTPPAPPADMAPAVEPPSAEWVDLAPAAPFDADPADLAPIEWPADIAEPIDLAPAPVEVADPADLAPLRWPGQLDAPTVLDAEPVDAPPAMLVFEPEPEPVVAELLVAEQPPVARDVVDATVATFRSGGGLDAAALDAAAALDTPRSSGPPSRRYRRR